MAKKKSKFLEVENEKTWILGWVLLVFTVVVVMTVCFFTPTNIPAQSTAVGMLSRGSFSSIYTSQRTFRAVFEVSQGLT